MSHTKGKLTVKGRGVYDKNNFQIAYTYAPQLSTSNAVLNAERIKYCWNTHDELVEALDAVRTYLNQPQYSSYGNTEIIELVSKALLAKVKA